MPFHTVYYSSRKHTEDLPICEVKAARFLMQFRSKPVGACVLVDSAFHEIEICKGWSVVNGLVSHRTNNRQSGGVLAAVLDCPQPNAAAWLLRPF